MVEWIIQIYRPGLVTGHSNLWIEYFKFLFGCIAVSIIGEYGKRPEYKEDKKRKTIFWSPHGWPRLRWRKQESNVFPHAKYICTYGFESTRSYGQSCAESLHRLHCFAGTRLVPWRQTFAAKSPPFVTSQAILVCDSAGYEGRCEVLRYGLRADANDSVGGRFWKPDDQAPLHSHWLDKISMVLTIQKIYFFCLGRNATLAKDQWSAHWQFQAWQLGLNKTLEYTTF